MIKILRIALVVALSALVIFVIFTWPLGKDIVQEWLNNIAMGK